MSTTTFQSVVRPPSPSSGEESFDFTTSPSSARQSPTTQLHQHNTSSIVYNKHFVIGSGIKSSSTPDLAASSSSATIPKSMKYTPTYHHSHSRNFSLSNSSLVSSSSTATNANRSPLKKTEPTPPQSPDLSGNKRLSRSSDGSNFSRKLMTHDSKDDEDLTGEGGAVVPASIDLSVEFPYLRATHSFDAQALFQEHNLDESASVCLSFDESDIAILHSVHTSGWGDATLLSTGDRGWIPTNYFVPYVESQAVPLLAAILTFVINPKSHEIKVSSSNLDKTPTGTPPIKDGRKFTFSQTSVTNIVAGVRSLLEMCGTLTRDSPIVKRSPSVRKFRKGLLTELAILVSLAKQHRNSTDDLVIENLLQACYKIVTKTVIFFDVWAIETDAKSKLEDDEPPSPSKQLHDSVLEHQRIVELREHKLQHSRSSSPSSAQNSPTRRKTIPTTGNRESVIFHSRPPFASQRLDEVNEALTTYLGIFIHRMSILETDPTASSQILLNTRKSMLACRELLASVEAVCTRSLPRSRDLERSKDNLYAQIRSLVGIAREVASASLEDFENADDPNSTRQVGYDKLVNIAVDCARSAGECVVRCRNILQHVGDFQLSSAREYPDFSDGLIAADDSKSRSSSDDSYTYYADDDDSSADYNNNNNTSNTTPLQPTNDANDEFQQHDQLRTAPSKLFKNLQDLKPDNNSEGVSHSSSNNSINKITESTASANGRVKSLLPHIPHLSPIRAGEVSPTSESTPDKFGDEEDVGRIEEVIYDANGQMRGATVRYFVSMLVDEKKSGENSMISSFFLTFRTFTTPDQVMDILVSRYDPDMNETDMDQTVREMYSARRLNIYNFIKRWMESHWRQSTDNVVIPRILDLADSHFGSAIHNGDRVIHGYARELTSVDTYEGAPIVERIIDLADEHAFYSARNIAHIPTLKKSKVVVTDLSKTQLNLLQKYSEFVNRDKTDVVEENSRSIMSVSTWASSIRKGSFSAGSLSANSSSLHLAGIGESNQNPSGLSILDFDAADIANQLTCIDYELFSKIQPNELIDQNFALKKRSLGLAPHVVELSQYSNQLSSFVGDSILGGVESGAGINQKTRTKLLKQWIKIADKCHDLGNFNTLLSIMSAMQSVNILRLKKIWEMLSAKYHTMFQNLKYVLIPDKNFSGYRNRLKAQQLPAIPYLGLYLTDLTFVEEGNPKFRRPPPRSGEDQPKIVNLDRCERTTKLIGELQRYQRVPYNIFNSDSLQFWLRSEMRRSHALVVRDQQGLWRRSCIVEPKA